MSATDEIRSFLDRFEAAWQANDGRAVAAQFVPDGSLINPFGARADGNDQLVAMYSEYFGTMLAGTSTSIAIDRIRAVGTDHAFVDLAQHVTAPDGAPVLTLHLAALVRRDGSQWRFVDARPYTYAAVPV